MRKAFFAALHDLMTRDGRVWFLTGDLGRGLVEPLFKDFPARAFNCGVIEPTMIGIAAGLAKAEKLPVVYSIAPFVTLRCAEQIRNDIVAHRLPVTIVGVGRDRTYKSAGVSHWFDEDEMQIVRNLGLDVWLPGAGPNDPEINSKSLSFEFEAPHPLFILMP